MKLCMKAKIASIHDKIEITDENKNPVYHIQSKLLSVHNVTYLRDAGNRDVATITRKVMSVHDTHFIEMSDGRTVELRSELLHIVKDVLDIPELGWQLQGNLGLHDYRLVDGEGRLLAQTHRKWMSLHNTYEIEIVEEENMDLIVAVLVTLDKMVGDRERTVRNSSTPSVQGSGAE